MTRRAFTLLEVLAALTLLGVLTGAVASLAVFGARETAAVAIGLEWEAAARATLQLIHDDLAAARRDRSSPHDGPAVQCDRASIVVAHGETLEQRFRGDGSSSDGRVTYRFDEPAGRLFRIDSRATPAVPRLLISNVSTLTLVPSADARMLSVTLVGPIEVNRSFRLP